MFLQHAPGQMRLARPPESTVPLTSIYSTAAWALSGAELGRSSTTYLRERTQISREEDCVRLSENCGLKSEYQTSENQNARP